MVNNSSFARWYEGILALITLLAIAFPKMLALGLLAFIPLAIAGLVKKQMHWKWQPVPLFFIALYGCYAFYALFTRNPEWAGRYLEYKLPFVIFPVMMMIVPRFRIRTGGIIAAVLLATLYLMAAGWTHALSCYGSTGKVTCFLTADFSWIHHPSYTSVYYTAALFLVWYACIRRKIRMPLWLAVLLSVLYILAIGMCMSLAGMLFLLLAGAVLVIVLVHRKWGKRAAWGLVIVLPVGLAGAIRFVPQLHGEWSGAKTVVQEYWNDPQAFIRNKQYPMSGSEVRLVMWTASMNAFSDYPMGVGTGNVDEVLTDYLNGMGQKELAKMQYNPHNQYLQTGLEIGWLGLLLLLAPFLIGWRIALRNSDWLLLLLVTSALFNMLFESMMQRQSGIVFYTFGICLLAMLSSNGLLDKGKGGTFPVRKPIQKR